MKSYEKLASNICEVLNTPNKQSMYKHRAYAVFYTDFSWTEKGKK